MANPEHGNGYRLDDLFAMREQQWRNAPDPTAYAYQPWPADDVRPLWYDKQGNPISDVEVMRLKYRKPDGKISDYARIGYDQIDAVTVSTVWLGLDHGFGGGPPLLFETMLFGYRVDDSPCVRYCTEAEAAAGHARVVEDLRAGRVPWFEQG